MAIIKNISKLVVPAYNKGPKDVVDYINAQAWIPTSADVGLIEYPGNFGSYNGTNGIVVVGGGVGDVSLQVTINATALVIPATTVTVSGTPSLFPLSFWPTSGYVRIDDEIIKYTGINQRTSSASGYDEFQLSAVTDRGVLGSTAASHTASASGPLMLEILLGSVRKIEYNKPLGIFNIWTRTTQEVGTEQSYGAGTITTTYETYLIPCPEDVVTFFETSPGVN
tara:strand:+ start:22 stop:693 length:672 start_codon:yes stop_codon:yes gene_type:complete